MRRHLLLLVVGSLAFWALAALPAVLVWGESALVHSAVAVGVCLVPTAATLAWARSLGEFGPILVFSGATRMRTEVLPTTVFLELSMNRIETAVAVSLLMVGAAVVVLVIVRVYGMQKLFGSER